MLSAFQLDLLCITETWFSESDTGIIEAVLPKTHSLLRALRSSWVNGRGGGVSVTYSLALCDSRLSPVDLDISSFEYNYGSDNI